MEKPRCVPENYLEVKDIKNTQILLKNMLKDFHAICDENGLIYNLFGGTMLGAVRHKGFIPWDDDIDVTMPRGDYEKLKSLDLDGTKYEVKCYPMEGYAYPFLKFCQKNTILIEDNLKTEYNILGLYIDVFPVDGYPPEEDETEYLKTRKELKTKRCFACMRPQPSPDRFKKLFFPFRLLQYTWYSMRGVNRYLSQEVEIAKRYSYDNSSFVLCYGAGWGKKGKLEKTYYLDRMLVDFEDIKVWNIREYDIHLTRLYGDYMQLPPKEKQISNHDYKLYVSPEVFETLNQ
jgi:lipopolysaccharide cholinephosphotransferase